MSGTAGPLGLYRNFANVGLLTLLSRLFGFVRDILMAVVLGAGPAADAFFAAFRFPNLFRRLFAEGAFNTAFVPLFAGVLEERGAADARALAGRILSWLVLVLFVVTLLAEIFMDKVLVPFVPGFLADPEKFELTVLLTRICFPYLALMSLMAAYAAILNGLSRFTAAAVAPVLLNLVMIGVLVPLILWPVDGNLAAIWVAISAIGGGVAQALLVYLAVRRAGFAPQVVWPKVDREVRKFWTLALPAVLAGGITQINIFIGTIIASQSAGAISYLYYADRLYQLPLGIIGIAIGTVLLPELARHLKGGRAKEAAQAQDQSIYLAILLSTPAAAGLIALALPIMEVLFERGAFTHLASVASADALIAFSLGLPGFVLIRVLQPGYFARQNVLTPTIFAAISVAVNIGLSLLLFDQFLHVGIAIATTVSAWLNVVLLAGGLLRSGYLKFTRAQIVRFGVVTALSALLGVALFTGAYALAGPLAAGSGLLLRALTLGLIMGLGFVGYFVLLHFSGVQRFGDLLGRMRRPLRATSELSDKQAD